MAPKPAASDAAPLRLALEASRGAVIAVHAAAGLARGHAQALRLLPAAKGICRSAVATLQATEAPKERGVGTGKGKEGKTDKDKGKGSEGDTAQPARRGRRRRRRRPRAACTAELELEDDAWADDVVAGHSARGRAACLGRLQEARRGSRSPRRNLAAASVATADAPPALLAGRIAAIRTLVARPDLSASLVELINYDPKAGRWLCCTPGGEKLRILPGKLAPTAEAGQRFLRLRWQSLATSVSTPNAQST